MLMRVALVTAVIVVGWGTAAGAQDTGEAGGVILQRVNLGDRHAASIGSQVVTLPDGGLHGTLPGRIREETRERP